MGGLELHLSKGNKLLSPSGGKSLAAGEYSSQPSPLVTRLTGTGSIALGWSQFSAGLWACGLPILCTGPAHTETHGLRLKRSLKPDALVSLFLCFSAMSFSFVHVICTLSGVGGAWVLAAAVVWDAVFLS